MREGQKKADVSGSSFKHVSTQLNPETYRKLYLMAVLTNTDLKQAAATAIEEYISKNWKTIKDKL